MKVFVFDAARCNGCCGCQIVCKDEHCGNDWMPYAKPQPMTGHFWCKVDQVVHGQAPVVKIEYTPRMCNHCDNAPCKAAAPDAVYQREDGLVIIDPIKAKGNKALQVVSAVHEEEKPVRVQAPGLFPAGAGAGETEKIQRNAPLTKEEDGNPATLMI